jgi:hypothetical protein
MDSRQPKATMNPQTVAGFSQRFREQQLLAEA